MGWLMVATAAETEEEEGGGEEGSTHQAGTEQVQVRAGEIQWSHLISEDISATKS